MSLSHCLELTENTSERSILPLSFNGLNQIEYELIQAQFFRRASTHFIYNGFGEILFKDRPYAKCLWAIDFHLIEFKNFA